MLHRTDPEKNGNRLAQELEILLGGGRSRDIWIWVCIDDGELDQY